MKSRKLRLASRRTSSMGRIVCALVLLHAALFAMPAHAADPYVLGVFPRTSAKDTHSRFTPLVRYLAAALGREVRLETSKDFDSFWRAVAAKRYDVVHYNQLHYLKSKKLYGYEVVLQNEEYGKTTIAATIIVHKDSGISEISQLAGKRIVFGGGSTAMVSYVAAKYLLMERGLSTNDFQEDFALNPPNAVMAVFYDQASAAGVGDVAPNFETLSNTIDVSAVKIIAKGDELPQLPWAVKEVMSADERRAVVEALLELNDHSDGKAILNQAGLTGIRTATDTDYDVCRKMIKRVTGEEF